MRPPEKPRLSIPAPNRQSFALENRCRGAAYPAFQRAPSYVPRFFGASFPDTVRRVDFFGITEARFGLPSFGA